jgi:hypothetical protein
VKELGHVTKHNLVRWLNQINQVDRMNFIKSLRDTRDIASKTDGLRDKTQLSYMVQKT